MLTNSRLLSFPLPFALWFLAAFSCLAQAVTPAAASKPGSGLEGTISLRGVTGGPVKMGVPDSAPLARTTFVVQQKDRVVSTFDTDSQGQFQVSLPAGHYTIVKKDRKSRVGFFGPFAVDIRAGERKTVHWDCETGMQ